MGKAGGPEHSAAIKRGLARAKERFDAAEWAHRCKHCDGPVEQSYTGRWREYCSHTCRQAAYRDRWPSFQKWYLQDHSPRCLQCHGPVEQPRTGRPREYCSRVCRQAAYRDRRTTH